MRNGKDLGGGAKEGWFEVRELAKRRVPSWEMRVGTERSRSKGMEEAGLSKMKGA